MYLSTDSVAMLKEAVMFEKMIAEKMMSETRDYLPAPETEPSNLKSVQLKPNLLDRVLPVVGQAMINAGLKLKYRQHIRLVAEDPHTPNFLIML
jgi:hypothetical protein